MQELITIFLIAISLSMDTFTLSLGLGTSNLTKKQSILFSITVGIFHFLMPLIGTKIGIKLTTLLPINQNILLGIILVYLGLVMLLELLHPEKVKYNYKLFNILLLAISVSIDSFSTGLGLTAITTKLFPSFLIFSLTSLTFTYLGLLIGKYANNLLGIYSTLFGSFLLILLGIINIL